MTRGPIRRAQLITPFGVGAMTVLKDGSSAICCGLDNWYKREDGETNSQELNTDDFVVPEWRLQRLLGVSHFRLPPDFRVRGKNSFLSIPYLRFPRWHFCPSCQLLQEREMHERGKLECPSCKDKGKRVFVNQVRFVAMCDEGHIQDFPWREWVHKSVSPNCTSPLRLISYGGTTLESEVVRCDCGLHRPLGGITSYSENDTTLTSSLDPDNRFFCKGLQPWLGTNTVQACDRPLRGTLRTATNVYFPHVKSSIFLPRLGANVPSKLYTLLETPPISGAINILTQSDKTKLEPATLRTFFAKALQDYSDQEILLALKLISDTSTATPSNETSTEIEDAETTFRREEFNVLKSERNEDFLLIRKMELSKYSDSIQEIFSRVMLVEKLRETKVLTGFSRIYAENRPSGPNRYSGVWKTPPAIKDIWLPAQVVYGEGIFLEFNESRIQFWLERNKAHLTQRLDPLIQRYNNFRRKKHLSPRLNIGARFLFIHTFSHLLINRLTFECGYSSAALRERLYISDDAEKPMAGLLIYTAAGDMDGTLGGLVERGRPGKLEPTVWHSIEAARWCSADPICMESGDQGGQGPDSCNLAACHNCALIPETACEEFNRLLDRGLVTGSITNPDLGFFPDAS
jgi:hypothetical protein